MKKRIHWKVLIFSLIIVYFVAFVGGIFTSSSTNSDWYDSIRPSITPPNFVFPIVWNVLFLMIALALYFSWIKAKGNEKRNLRIVFGINLALNLLWSFLYFGIRSPRLAFIDLILLWISIISMIYVSYKIDRKAAWLLVPYFIWVSFAGILNWLSI